MRHFPLSLPAAALAALLAACSEPAPDLPRLEFLSSMPREITVGDTTEALSVTKYSASATGREEKVEYHAFTLRSSDTAVVRIVEGRRMLGLQAGTSAITAQDDQGTARTPSALTVTVK